MTETAQPTVTMVVPMIPVRPQGESAVAAQPTPTVTETVQPTVTTHVPMIPARPRRAPVVVVFQIPVTRPGGMTRTAMDMVILQSLQMPVISREDT